MSETRERINTRVSSLTWESRPKLRANGFESSALTTNLSRRLNRSFLWNSNPNLKNLTAAVLLPENWHGVKTQRWGGDEAHRFMSTTTMASWHMRLHATLCEFFTAQFAFSLSLSFFFFQLLKTCLDDEKMKCVEEKLKNYYILIEKLSKIFLFCGHLFSWWRLVLVG